jgi:hypothetical protein
MSTTLTQPKLSCPNCKQKLRFKKQLREGSKCKCPNCHGYFIFSTKDPYAETETYELEIQNFEILASDFDKPIPMEPKTFHVYLSLKPDQKQAYGRPGSIITEIRAQNATEAMRQAMASHLGYEVSVRGKN